MHGRNYLIFKIHLIATYSLSYKRQVKIKFHANEKKKLSDLSKNNPRGFWNYINNLKRSKKNTDNNFDSQEFIDFFKNLCSGDNSASPNHESTQRDSILTVAELDRPFTVEEITKTIKCLNRNKSADFTGNVADFLIDGCSFLAPYLTIVFNKIFETGIYPSLWAEGVIVPIHKKGEKTNPANYRCITLVNILVKLFSLALRNRLNLWSENDNFFNSSQFGFRDKCSTVDCIFLLHTVIQKVFLNKRKLYCAFIDYEKAFDSINRHILWDKLINLGVSCKMVNMLRSMYSNVKSCILLMNENKYSDFKDVTIGLKQGDPLSTILFLFFINDISGSLDLENLNETNFDILTFYMLLFADDIALFSTSPDGLQLQLNNINTYSKRNGLKININKTKICIFEKRKSNNNHSWTIDNQQLEIVTSFCYLGVNLYYTGNFRYSVKSLVEKANRAYHHLLILFDKIQLDIQTKLKLFETMVTPIMLYGAEVWGIYGYDEIDRLQMKFYKSLLGVNKQTINAAVYGELGRYPLTHIAKERSINYWLKIKSRQNPLIYNAYDEQLGFSENKVWANRVARLVETLGHGNLLFNFNSEINYRHLLLQRIQDQYIQTWFAKIQDSSKLYYYRLFKTNFEMEPYLTVTKNNILQMQFARFRLSAHQLNIEKGRHLQLNRNERLCTLCNSSAVESEFHFLLNCQKYLYLRRKYNINQSRATISTFKIIMSTKHTQKLLNLMNFVKSAMELRNQSL